MPSDRPSPLPRWVKVLLWTGLALFLGWLGWVQLIRDETVRAPEGFLARPENVVFQPEENGLELIRELEFIRTPQGDWRQHKQQQEILKLRAPWNQEVMQPLVDAAPAVERWYSKPCKNQHGLPLRRRTAATPSRGLRRRIFPCGILGTILSGQPTFSSQKPWILPAKTKVWKHGVGLPKHGTWPYGIGP